VSQPRSSQPPRCARACVYAPRAHTMALACSDASQPAA
jgi:hypothetical protein